MNPEQGRLLASALEILKGWYGLLSCAPWPKWSERHRSPLQMVGRGTSTGEKTNSRLGFARWRGEGGFVGFRWVCEMNTGLGCLELIV